MHWLRSKKELVDRLGRSLGDLGQSYWIVKEENHGAFMAGTGASESWSGMQGAIR